MDESTTLLYIFLVGAAVFGLYVAYKGIE